ncbi:MAG: hypothetical protein KDA75_12270 [Planctomycetaceae bacterium]|nr:hypothetical protein [Planctomycetaceae bacterium]
MAEPTANTPDPPTAATAEDRRLYVPDHERYRVRIMTGAERSYCYQRTPGQDYYHLIVPGEIYLDGGEEKLCLNCALRRGVTTIDRLFWQKRSL